MNSNQLRQKFLDYFKSKQPDFEVALQYAIAGLAKAECLITRNASDFPKRGKIPVLAPEEFLRKQDD